MSRVAAAMLAGAALLGGGGVALAALAPADHVSRIGVQVTPAGSQPAVAALARATVTSDNASQLAHVPSATIHARLRVDAVPGTSLVRLTYRDPSALRATSVARQAAAVLASLAAARLGAQGVRLAVVEPAREVGRRRHWLLYGLVGTALGAVLGLSLALGLHPAESPQA